MNDASPPPRDDDWGEYFLAFILLGPALVGTLLTIGRPLSTYLLASLAGAFSLAAVGAVDNEITNYDNTAGVVLVFTFLYEFLFALPAVLLTAILRVGLVVLRRR